jgi:hypothetical protein
VDRSAFERGAGRSAVSPRPDRVPLHERPKLLRGVEGHRHSEQLTVEAEDERLVGFAQPDGALGNRLKYPLQIERRAADDFEHAGGGGLLLKRFAQIIRAFPQLVEQPRILDGDHRLIREGGDQFDLLVGERLYICSPDENCPYDISLPQERGSERRSVAASLLVLKIGVLSIGQHIGNMHQPAFKRRSSNNTTSIHCDRMLFDVFLIFCREAIACGDTEEFAVT